MMKIFGMLIAFSLLFVGSSSAQCDLPADYSNFAIVTEGDLQVTFATDKRTYRPGDVVRFHLIVQNLGTATFYINWGTDPQDGIFVMADSCEAVDQGDCFANSVFHHPFLVFFFSGGTRLDPDKCRISERTWNTASLSTPGGIFSVLGGMFEPYAGLTSGEFRVPTSGVRLQLTIDGRVPTEHTTWSRIKALYS